jgi:hypothetical protein
MNLANHWFEKRWLKSSCTDQTSFSSFCFDQQVLTGPVRGWLGLNFDCWSYGLVSGDYIKAKNKFSTG